MKRVLIILAALVLITAAAARASACSCAGETAPCQAYWEASAVFVGTVINGRSVTVKDAGFEHEMRAVRLFVDEPMRGVEGGEIEVLTGLGGGDCGFGFRQSQQYIVYAYRDEDDKKLYTSICSRTRLLAEAAKDLAYIRGLSKAKPGGTISGEVSKQIRNDEGSTYPPLANVKVIMEGPGTYEAVTDAKGQYRVEGVTPGEYTVRAQAPPGLAARGPDRTAKVVDRGCAEISFWLESSSGLSGRVLNPQGLPVANAEIFLVSADKERWRGYFDAAYADKEGNYAFKLIPPGRYVLIIRYDGTTSQTRPFPPMYYPGVADKTQAEILTFKEGATFANHDLKVPPLPAEYDVRGSVVWADGTPAKGARIAYMVGGDAVVYGVQTNETGEFSFKAYEGLKLSISAQMNRENRQSISSPAVTITVEAGAAPLKFVLPSP
jgi:hypothetical protein